MLKKTIIIGEHHDDPCARLFVRLNSQSFKNKGFSIFGFEHGEKTNLKTDAYFGWGERLFRFYSNSDSGFVRTGISILLERFYQARWHYRLGLFSL